MSAPEGHCLTVVWRSERDPVTGNFLFCGKPHPCPDHDLPRAVAFEVLGIPAPQGSKTRMPNGAMLDGGSKGARDKHKNWRSAVADTARDVAQHDDVPAPFSEPVHVTVAFRFPMPKGRLKRLQSDSGVAWKRSTPDIDKIIRSTLDGLVVGGLLSDDKVVCELSTSKVETVGWTGAEVWIERLPSVPS